MADELSDFIEASGLLEYDPNAIAKIYQGHPTRLLRRLWQTLIPIALFFITIGIDKLTGVLKDHNHSKLRAKQFTNLLVELGPAFIKGGQALSTRPDIIPPLVLEELSQLQDQLPGFDCKLALACIEEDLNIEIKDVFQYLEEKPISAASLGQVHKGVLISGEKVAVKVQRPGLREQITLDLYILRNISSWLKQNIGIIRSDLVALIDELGKRVFEEMDYLNEANNAIKFKNLHAHNTKIAVPKIFKDITSRRVLTMEWIDGVKLTNLEAVQNLGIDPNEMVEIGVNCSLQQLLEHGFFHADPHPGNLLALPDGRLCYLDFGMMSEVSRKSRTGLIKAVVHLVNKKFNKLSKDFVELGFLASEVNLEPIVPAFEKIFTNALEVGVNKMDFKSVTDDMSGVMYKFPFKIPPYYALVIRSLITLEGIALSVDPNFKILGAAYPYFAKRLMEDPDPQLRKSLKEMLFDGKIIVWSRLDDLLQTAKSNTELNLEGLTDQIIEFLYSKNGKYLREEIAENIAERIDQYAWNIIKRIKHKLPRPSKNKQIIKSKKFAIQNSKEIQPINLLIKTFPGFKVQIILKRLPKILIKHENILIGRNIALKITEKGIIRVIKYAVEIKE